MRLRRGRAPLLSCGCPASLSVMQFQTEILGYPIIIERRMNCLFITAGGRKVRVFELVGCSDQCPHPPQPPLPRGKGGGADCRSISSFFCWGGGGRGPLITNIHLVLYFSYSPESVSLTTYVTDSGSFFHFPPGGVHKQKGW
jgi:hypothetical protein